MNRAYGFSIAPVTGVPQPNAVVQVFFTGTLNLAPIFSDDLAVPTPRANPFLADANGYWNFYAVADRYDVRITPTGIASYTLGDVNIPPTVQSGFATFLGAGSVTVVLPQLFPDTLYQVSVLGSVGETFSLTSINTGTFTISSSDAASTAVISWIAVRP